MNALIKVDLNENQEPIVSGRELHEALEVKTAYKDWFPRMCEYGFTEGIDFCSILSESTGGRPETNHAIKLDMAKEIAMIQRSDKGKQVRQYFIQVEKDFNSPEKVMARALKFAEQRLNVLQVENAQQKHMIETQRPKVLFADSVESSETSILIGDLAKLIKQNGHDIGQNRLFEWLRNNDYLIKSGERKNMPTQKSMDMKLFEVKERTVSNPDGSIRITKTPKVTGKGQIHFINTFLNMLS
jgi:anti-repressor protein